MMVKLVSVKLFTCDKKMSTHQNHVSINILFQEIVGGF